MTEKYKKKKRTAYSFYTGLIKFVFVLVGIVVIGAIMCASFVKYSIDKQIRQDMAIIQPLIREQCELPNYQATAHSHWYWDPIASYYDYVEEQNLVVV